MNGVVFSSQNEAFEADQGSYGQECLYGGRPWYECVSSPSSPQVETIELPAYIETKDGKERLAEQTESTEIVMQQDIGYAHARFLGEVDC